MAKRQGGLGKGLGALIPDRSDTMELSNNCEDKKNMVELNLIKPNPNQPRKNFDYEKIKQLSQSIKENGIIQPIILKRTSENTYIIVAGERRWRAAKELGLKQVPAICADDITDEKLLKLSLIENIQREDLNPIEEAQAYEKLMNELHMTQQELSESMGKSRTAITNCLRLLNLNKDVQEYLIDGVISEGHGRALLGLNEPELQSELAKKIIDESLSVRQTEMIVKHINDKKVVKTKDRLSHLNQPYYKDIKQRLENYFGTKVALNCKNNNKGKIEIEYYSEEDLQRIIEILNI
ncbi:chromosome partitioning protein, ParB family [Hathewaya proteolytica DSM 3090]|uniref:Chromosome partitioning protein, ParB family n=1 Tax=Hathewaya proteolytica DSM 3090 TaxID=1121331 RepID=A0A1M6MNJ4_9CLOT|nr:ParB/RepB/Spo0J family partition protein [Hathewaya proteolytica]SHJ85058.1 chromosome partitioning protein, ParB family [Hathewaya proteolytica DSM 3090]